MYILLALHTISDGEYVIDDVTLSILEYGIILTSIEPHHHYPLHCRYLGVKYLTDPRAFPLQVST